MQDQSFTSLEDRYSDLPLNGKVLAEYVWIDANNCVRSKTKTLLNGVTDVSQCREWDFDGSSTGQAVAGGPNGSDIIIKPCSIFKDPFRRGDHVLVMCDTYHPNGTPHETNHRVKAMKFAEKYKKYDTWFGLEQEYTMLGTDGRPYGWPKNGFPAPQGPYYCGIGAGKVFRRDLVNAHYMACLYAGVKVSGINAEVMPSQWEFQVGPCTAEEMGDHLWIARYILQRMAEDFDVVITFHPKPLQGDWNGAGCHTNVSTNEMRNPGGIKQIEEAINKLSNRHKQHLAEYGEDNELRLTGIHETGHISQFSFGIAQRGCSIRIPRAVQLQGCGYFEDRRPASNADPYRIVAVMLESICGE